MKTGIYVRIHRNNNWINEEIEQLSQTELVEFFKDETKDTVLRFLAGLCRFIREDVKSEGTQQ